MILSTQLFNLQIVNGTRFAGLADGNRLRSKISYAQRGRILDRRGIVLAENVPSFQLSATPYQLPDSPGDREGLYQLVAGYIGASNEVVKETIEAKGIDYTQPILVAENLNYQQALQLEQKLPNLSGLSLDAIPIRHYKSDSGLSHILGYVGRVSDKDLLQTPGLKPVDFIGKDGIEASYDSLLRGQNGIIETEVDAQGRPIRTLAEQTTRPGQDIVLSIDYGLQQELASAISEQMQRANVTKASGVAIDPRSGEVLAMVSLPDFDNNQFSQGISANELRALTDNELSPLTNKAISASYPSGSIIKPMHLTAALQENVVNEQTVIVDSGKIVVPSQFDPSVSYTFNGWNPAGLGPMNARRAIAMSSDIYFYHTGGGFQNFKGLGVERLTDYYRQFGLGQHTGIDLPGESAGLIPSPKWMQEVHGREWVTGDTYNISIGQGDIRVSPLQMATATAALLNEGKVVAPHIFNSTTNGESKMDVKYNGQVKAKSEYLKVAREGMRQVIGGTTSTATFAAVPVPVAGKSGTAETDPTTKRRSHAWYVAYAPYDTAELVFSVLLEEGEGAHSLLLQPSPRP